MIEPNELKTEGFCTKQGVHYIVYSKGHGHCIQYNKGNVCFLMRSSRDLPKDDVRKVAEKIGECDIMQMHTQETHDFIFSHVVWP